MPSKETVFYMTIEDDNQELLDIRLPIHAAIKTPAAI